MENQASEQQSYEDVRKSGYLRKQKSMHRRYFVLRAASERGPARLEYYESEKKFRGKAPVPKKALNLETCFNINKRADSKNKHMIVLYTRAESFSIAAESEADQDEWFQAMLDLQCKSKTPHDSGSGGDYGVPSPGPAFKEVWQVKVWPKGLGQAKNLVGIYRLCLTEKTVNFVKLNSDAAAVVLQLMNVRRCGHSENFFFVEVGRSSVTGPGEFWMQVEDSVVAQNMHETLLESMKALSEEFHQRSKSQSAAAAGGGATASNPISVPSRRHHPNPPPSQVGFTRRPRTEPPGGTGGAGSNNTSPTPRHSFPRARTASDGGKVEEGGAAAAGGGLPSSSPNGSCSTTPTLRPKSARTPTPAKTPITLMRSASTPAPSPAPSLSSSSGHGSEFGGGGAASTYSRLPHHTSVSGSPSDYGSSDEYGSSPGEHSQLTPDLPGGSSGSLSYHPLGDEASNYIMMGQRGVPTPLQTQASHPPTRRVLRRSSSRECEAERRLLSKRASLPPMALDRLAPHRRPDEEAEEDDYAVMSRSTSRESFTSRRDSGMGPGAGVYLDVAGEFREKSEGGGAGGGVDNGYMSMLPGVTAPPVSLSQSLSVAVSDSTSKPADDYMAMTPNNSVSPPQQIRPPPAGSDGYMMMSPNSSCSPDQRGMGGAWVGSSSADSRAGSDYMNMSPISARSANSTPPPSEGLPHPELLPQPPPQAAPKMVYSYYSLPRSYKHMPPVHFEEDGGRGRRAGGRGGGRGAANPGRQEPSAGSAVGRHLSLSSSSYSSSSASSESLGESEEKPARAAAGRGSKDGTLQQRRGSAGQQPGQQQQSRRPVSLFVDVSKANTLPGSGDPPPPGAQEPRGVRQHRVQGRQGQGWKRRRRGRKGAGSGSVSATGTLQALAPTDLLPGRIPASSSQPFDAPDPTHRFRDESRMPLRAEEGAEAGHRKDSATDSPTSCGDYTEMAFSLGAASTPGSTTSPKPPSPGRHEQQGPELGLGLGLDFSLAKASPNPDQGAKVIRADPQGRRRHCSETFLASPPMPPPSSSSSSSSSSLYPEHTQSVARRLGFDGMLWGNGAASEAPSQCANPGPSGAPAAQASSMEQGLNYIDLDLVNKDNPHSALEGPVPSQPLPARLYSAVMSGGAGGAGGGVGGGGGAGTASNLNTYASIDFYKSEELRTHHNGSKDGTEC
ncbi:hypothetical protein MATL_G00167570 [Megalops atlanticus]|uniref:Insulin receptor substrate 1 n=1 Tax=Megalops atlanticus TaxID=7932 RepID=A0A9D3T6V2_MEGAT|nr:hypothetical protein MATL_G00167570 [Megalops atlanticus]